MDRALWLLLRLRLGGWLRRLGRSVGTVRGALFVAAGALVFLPYVLNWLLTGTSAGEHVAEARRFGPLALAAFCLMQLFLTTEGAITFSAAEVNLLFPAPLSRRQILAYKLVGTFGALLLTTALMTLFLRPYAPNAVAAAVGLLLALTFVQLVHTALALLASAIGAGAWNRRRKLVLAALGVLIAVAVAPALARGLDRDWQAILREIEASPVAQTLLAPFAWFTNAFTATELWPELAQWAGLGLLADLALLALVFLLDAQYLETSAAASERAYARLQRLRRGGPVAASLPRSGKARLSVPPLPDWGGVGPIAWRQLTTAVRSPYAIFIVLIFMAAIAAPLLASSGRRGNTGFDAGLAVSLIATVALFVPPLLPFDFRGDVDRMELLKTLPLPAWKLVVGQLLVPVLLVSLLQLGLVVLLQAVWGRLDALLLGVVGLLLPVNFLIFGLENLLFLWFPTRQVATPADLQNMGRQIVVWVLKLLVLNVLVGFALLAGLLAYLIAGQSLVAGGVVAWLVLAGFVAGLVPLVALAFRGFDVARDAP